VDLPTQTISTDSGLLIHFEFDPVRKDKLLRGLDDIGLTLAVRERIEAFEGAHYKRMPWLPGAREVGS
jgi:3-isopropylmalate/(R)-2-methylmalate dehydratase small subunit